MAMDAILLGKSLDELSEIACDVGAPEYRGRQLAEWLYKQHAESFDEMSNLPAALRQELARGYRLGRASPTHTTVSQDGSRKYLFAYDSEIGIETALIPDRDRRTLCISTQAGCRRGCRFCFTAKAGFHGNLSAAEILNQYASCPERDSVSNIVFMGMGEPFDNPDAVLRAIDVFTADYGYAKSPGRLTVSTVGVIPQVERYLREARSHLAVSLNSPFPAERAELMPAERKYPIRDLLKILRNYDWSGQRRLTFEYIMFADLNDSRRHAEAVVKMLRGLECRVNLIAFNECPGIDMHSSGRDAIESFQQCLRAQGIRATVRKSKGRDIAAACGQLSGGG